MNTIHPVKTQLLSVPAVSYIAVVILVLFTVGCNPSSTTSPTDAPVELVEDQVVAGGLDPATPENVAAQVVASQDGLSLIERHCSKCHTAQSLEQVKKSRSEWETALKLMKLMGVRLDDTEELSLLDYLASTGKP